MKWSDAKKELMKDWSRWERIHYHVTYWFESKLLSFKLWIKSFEPCPKEEQGYRCRHQILSNGVLECGERKEKNYWKPDDE